ncbi:MAG: CtsR family transcriptional regulator [Clostridia bacterium]|nr:CtsR family transcriptional regulator [Clostridia bacterium]
MASISDIIENFILKTLGDDDYVEISRNELAGFFSCAPSQINYVLETRFTVDRGFLIESRRGGGGFIKISKLRLDDDSYITDLVLESVGNELSEKRMVQILERLTREKVISGKESAIALECLSDDSLTMPIIMREKVRARAFKNVLVSLLKADGGDEHDV